MRLARYFFTKALKLHPPVVNFGVAINDEWHIDPSLPTPSMEISWRTQ
jgi:hypothetical protein